MIAAPQRPGAGQRHRAIRCMPLARKWQGAVEACTQPLQLTRPRHPFNTTAQIVQKASGGGHRPHRVRR